MDDLIRRSATAKDLREYAERKAQVNGIEYANGILAAACRIEQISPAVDAVEVVRCRECKRWESFKFSQKHFCPQVHEWTEADFYCAYGETR